jgi:hypothetical protein
MFPAGRDTPALTVGLLCAEALIPGLPARAHNRRSSRPRRRVAMRGGFFVCCACHCSPYRNKLTADEQIVCNLLRPRSFAKAHPACRFNNKQE